MRPGTPSGSAWRRFALLALALAALAPVRAAVVAPTGSAPDTHRRAHLTDHDRVVDAVSTAVERRDQRDVPIGLAAAAATLATLACALPRSPRERRDPRPRPRLAFLRRGPPFGITG
jgi:hypothetical protein